MIIDNFLIVREHLDFISPLDRYIVHILRRPKDCKNLTNALGSNEAQRLIRTYYIDSLEYFDSKIPAIKELCESCNARAYIIVQPKDNFECLLNLGKKILDTVQNKNYSVKPEHLIRQAYCEHHSTRKKQWIIDLDNDCMTEYIHTINYGGQTLVKKQWSVDDVLSLIKEYVKKAGKDINDVYVVPTKNGKHIITPPFNLQAVQRECSLMYEGVHSFVTELIPSNEPYMPDTIKKSDVTGWLHKDGMTLLYFNNSAI